MTDLISVIVSTYNREDALAAVLRSLARQSDANFEVLVADDGSGTATARVITDWAARMPVPLRHVWHPDRGFRLAEIRNRAIRASGGAYCIFLDGDCITRQNFVAAHRRLAEPGWFVTGNRILLSRALSERVMRVNLEPEQWRLADWLAERSQRHINRFTPLLALPLGRLRYMQAQRWRGARGSNMAFWRSDLDKVDGFDAAYSGWGREDSDIFIRMIRAGVKRKDGRFATGVLHLWHPEADRARLAENERILAEVVDGTRVRAKQGLTRVIEETSASIAHA
jgi:glycosyltransferase involved in cell wall biosynthesis